MEIRRITGMTKEQQEFNACYTLWSTCFGDSKEYMDYYFAEKVKDNVIYVLEVEGTIVSMLHLNPYQVKLGEKEQLAYYIVGVATDPNYRKRGYMGQLLRRMFDDLYEDGHPFTYLMPAAYEIYAPYDFRYIYEQTRLSLTKEEMKTSLEVKVWTALNQQQQEQGINLVESKLEETFSVYATRSMAYYDRLSFEMKAAEGEVVAILLENEVCGIAAYMSEPKENGRELAIVEYVGKILEARELASVLMKRVEGGIQAQFYETAFLNVEKEVEQKPIIMARAVDVKRLLETMRNESKEHTTVIVKVEDSFIEKNNATYSVTYNNENAVVTTVKQEPEFTLDMPEFVQWFFAKQQVYINEIV